MTIASHLAFINSPDEDNLFTAILYLAKTHPSDRFIIFVPKKVSLLGKLPGNVTELVVSLNNAITRSAWFNFKLPSILKDFKVSFFVSSYGLLSKRLGLPQYLFINTLDLSKITEASLTVAAKIFCTQKYILNEMEKKFSALKNKTELLLFEPTSKTAELDLAEKRLIQERFTGGDEYFIVAVTIQTKSQVVPALKAFSIFKKWQKSSMKLVLLLIDVEERGIIPAFDQYKFKSEVVVADHRHSGPLMGAAYAFIYLPLREHSSCLGLEALSAGVPLIVCEHESLEASYGDAAMYTKLEPKAIGACMQELYKDEKMRASLIREGKTAMSAYNTASSSDQLYYLLSTYTDS